MRMRLAQTSFVANTHVIERAMFWSLACAAELMTMCGSDWLGNRELTLKIGVFWQHFPGDRTAAGRGDPLCQAADVAPATMLLRSLASQVTHFMAQGATAKEDPVLSEALNPFDSGPCPAG